MRIFSDILTLGQHQHYQAAPMTHSYRLPIILLTFCLSALSSNVFSAPPIHLSSNTDSLPDFSAPSIYGSSSDLTPRSLRGQVSLLNVWASWCSACASEHRLLMKIKNVYHVPIYGILYKDSANDALNYLNRNGNPYVQIGNDPDGAASMGFNIYGTPETFVVSPDGDILYRQTGAMTQMTWDVVLYPIIKHYQDKQ